VIDSSGPSDSTMQGGAAHQPGAPAAGLAQIVISLEGRVARTLALNVPIVTIGRTPANLLPLPHESVSRAHAELRVSPDGVILTDTGSANGTFIGDVRLAPQQPVQLTPGTVFRIGPFMLRYEAAQVAQAESAPEAAVEERPAPQKSAPVPLPVPAAVYAASPPPRNTHIVPLPHDPVSNYLDFLPVIFQDGDFLGRFLLIFQSIWEPLEYRQDHLPMYFDPRTCPEPFLQWLADWLGVVVGPVSEEGRLRMLLGEAVELYRWRGTRYGLTRMIEISTGITPLIGEAPEDPAVLRIRVSVPPESSVDRDAIERLIVANKPAHAAYLLEVYT
jgi:phage tail-like protein